MNLVRHIVQRRVKDSFQGRNKPQLTRGLKEKLEVLPRLVPGILQLEVGTHLGAPSGRSGDLVLVTVFRDRSALAVYDNHPGHMKVKPFVGEGIAERRAVDYEI